MQAKSQSLGRRRRFQIGLPEIISFNEKSDLHSVKYNYLSLKFSYIQGLQVNIEAICSCQQPTISIYTTCVLKGCLKMFDSW